MYIHTYLVGRYTCVGIGIWIFRYRYRYRYRYGYLDTGG